MSESTMTWSELETKLMATLKRELESHPFEWCSREIKNITTAASIAHQNAKDERPA